MPQSIPDLSEKGSENDFINQRLSKSLMRLNFEHRNIIREEVHGVQSMERHETCDLIGESLQRMEIELNRIVSSTRNHPHAFEDARSLPNTFVNDRDFRLKFLRAELFDPIKAADRMIVHLDYLLHLFGHRAMVEPLNGSFLDNEETTALRKGYIQVMPFRDRGGRRIMVALAESLSLKPVTRVRGLG